jgi:hypothetical protein
VGVLRLCCLEVGVPYGCFLGDSLIEALIEMVEQLALHRGSRHGVVGAA